MIAITVLLISQNPMVDWQNYGEQYRYFRQMEITDFYHPAGRGEILPRELAVQTRPYYMFVFRTSDLVDRVYYFNPGQQPANNSDGIHEWLFSYGRTFTSPPVYGDEPHVIELPRVTTSVATRDTRGRAVANRERVAFHYFDYDESGNMIRVVFADANNRPVMTPGGFAEVRMRYAGPGLVRSRRYYDDNGSPTLATGMRVHEVRYEYDGQGRTVMLQYFDTELNPLTSATGIWAVGFEYDAVGNTRRTYYDINGRPIGDRS